MADDHLRYALNKVNEECGELIRIAAKMIAYPDTDEHPDGQGSMRMRLEDELADVVAICSYLAVRAKLDVARIEARACEKVDRFRVWFAEEAQPAATTVPAVSSTE
jgi:NTP pyrophosphatase (non-canonical NTP hydrolase)